MILIDNPIFKREFAAVTRSFPNNLIIISYLLALSIILILLWPSAGVHSVASAESKQIFSIFFSLNLALILLIVPAFSATSITSEKENNTFASLFVTLLSPFEIMIGKLTSALLALILLVVFAMPIASICALTGGISNMLLLKLTLVILLAALSYGLAGLACSAICERSTTAVVMNYTVIAIFAGASWLPGALLNNLLPSLQGIFQIIRSFSPFDTIFYLLYPEAYKLTSTVTTYGIITPFTVFCAFSFLLMIISFIVYERTIFKPPATSKTLVTQQYTDFRKLVKRKLTWPFYLIDPLKRKKNIANFANPVFVAELRSRIFGNPRFIIRTVSTIFILSLMIMTLVALQFGEMVKAESVRMAAIIFQIGIIALLAPGLSSGLITDEISSGTFVMLRMTLLSPATVVLGKLKATFFYAMIFVISSFFVLFTMAFLEQQNIFPETSILSSVWWTELVQRAKSIDWWKEVWTTYRRIFIWIFLLLLNALVFLCAGLFSSSVCRKTSTATAMAYVTTAIICVVTLLPLIVKSKFSPEINFFILSFNPVASALQVVNGAFAEYPGIWMKNIFIMISLIVFFICFAMARTWWLFHTQD